MSKILQHWYVQAVIVRVSAKLLKKALRFTDERAKLESELLSGVDVVKCAAWEVGLAPLSVCKVTRMCCPM